MSCDRAINRCHRLNIDEHWEIAVHWAIVMSMKSDDNGWLANHIVIWERCFSWMSSIKVSVYCHSEQLQTHCCTVPFWTWPWDDQEGLGKFLKTWSSFCTKWEDLLVIDDPDIYLQVIINACKCHDVDLVPFVQVFVDCPQNLRKLECCLVIDVLLLCWQHDLSCSHQEKPT